MTDNFLGSLNVKNNEFYRREDLVNEEDLDPRDHRYPDKVVELYSREPLLLEGSKLQNDPEVYAVIYKVENGEMLEEKRVNYPKEIEEYLGLEEKAWKENDRRDIIEMINKLVPVHANDPAANETGIIQLRNKLSKREDYK